MSEIKDQEREASYEITVNCANCGYEQMVPMRQGEQFIRYFDNDRTMIEPHSDRPFVGRPSGVFDGIGGFTLVGCDRCEVPCLR